MKITLIQESIEFADKTANLAKFKKHFEQLLGKSDLVVLPEMFSTGFCTNSPELAEDMNGQTVDFLKYWAAKGNFAIAGSFIATENNLLF
ncbi:MAG: nitrilase family protein, partial [Paludibacter sp.]|nr:nitrilase family protein [Paludibacter sp.]